MMRCINAGRARVVGRGRRSSRIVGFIGIVGMVTLAIGYAPALTASAASPVSTDAPPVGAAAAPVAPAILLAAAETRTTVAATVGATVVATTTPYATAETSATVGATVAATTAPQLAVTASPLLGALKPSASNTSLASQGFGELVISGGWSAIEPSKGVFSGSAISSLQAAINKAISSGLHVSLDIGVQYAPSWIFTVGGGTQFKDQYGDVFSGSSGSGNDVPNAVTDQLVRTQLGAYIDYLGSHLTGVSSVRLGGAAYNELRYPTGDSGTHGDAYWFYDTSSQAGLVSSVRGWKPGTGSAAQATTFLNAYNAALVNYGAWLVARAGAAFPTSTELEVLMPGWGERPGEPAAAEANLLRATPDELNEGLDWVDLLRALPHTGRIVAYTTWGDSTNGGTGNPDPAAYIHSILPSGMAAGGESTGNGQTSAAGETAEFHDAKAWHWYVANWFFNGQSQTPAQVQQVFGSA